MKGLVVLHIDGLGHDSLNQALAAGDLPFTRRLIDEEGFSAQPYRCGIPSTTPFAQAGILYGDNREIPSFRWFDKEAQTVVAFGAGSTFKKVAGRYFEGAHPLCEEGACIAACYPAGASETFGLSYRDRDRQGGQGAAQVLRAYAANPVQVAGFLGHGLMAVGRSALEYMRARAQGRRPAGAYVITDMLEEMLLHHAARYAVCRAMRQGYPVIYAAFYAFDETGHAFGPDDGYAMRILRHVDHTIRAVARARGDGPGYELIVLSDHGQIDTVPFNRQGGVHLGELVFRRLPDHEVEEQKGRTYRPAGAPPAGRVVLTYSGGLGHLYFTEPRRRLDRHEVQQRAPGLVEYLGGLADVEFALLRERGRDLLVDRDGERPLEDAHHLLARFDDPRILAAQLARLNSFERSGDVILFGRWDGRTQVNFENQAGGHGSIGGEQMHPFLLARRELGLDLSHIEGAHQVHPLLMRVAGRTPA